MKRQKLLPLLLLSTFSTGALAGFLPEGHHKWVGSWQCNLDGRAARIEFAIQDGEVSDLGGGVAVRRNTIRLVGRISDNGGAWKSLTTRRLDGADPRSREAAHLLPLRYDNREDWFLMMHTWNERFASGFTRWRGRVFGLQCRKQ